MIGLIKHLSLWRTERICQIIAVIILDYSCRTVLLLDSLVTSPTLLKARWGWKLTVQYPHGYMLLNIARLCFQVCLYTGSPLIYRSWAKLIGMFIQNEYYILIWFDFVSKKWSGNFFLHQFTMQSKIGSIFTWIILCQSSGPSIRPC